MLISMQLFDRMCMTLGGRAAEAKIFRRVTTGMISDTTVTYCMPCFSPVVLIYIFHGRKIILLKCPKVSDDCVQSENSKNTLCLTTVLCRRVIDWSFVGHLVGRPVCFIWLYAIFLLPSFFIFFLAFKRSRR